MNFAHFMHWFPVIVRASFIASPLLLITTARAQGPSYQDRLYYTCKVWGFVKYHHSAVSRGMVAWDDVLLRTLPLVRAASTVDAFNDALDTMIVAAGAMEPATTPSPDTLPAHLKRNLDHRWLGDPLLREGIRAKLVGIRDHFRPHPLHWVRYDDGTQGCGVLCFPYDTPCIAVDASKNLPDEATRALLLAKYWNIMYYFNPNLYITDVPWDSTLARNAVEFVSAPDYARFYAAFLRIAAALNDAHVDGMTYTNAYPTPMYRPMLILRDSSGAYVVVKSGYPEIVPGDRILSMNGRTMKQLEDSLRPIVSSGNQAVFHRDVISHLMSGVYGSKVRFEYTDSLGSPQALSTTRVTSRSSPWFTKYYPSDSLSAATWKKWICNVGYVQMGNLVAADVAAMCAGLRDTKAIIFDVRNYPKGTVRTIADLIFPRRLPICRWIVPDAEYPGTCYQVDDSCGSGAPALPYTGKVIILCNEQTQSHAEFTCMILRAMPGAVIVGSQTAGADGNVTTVRPSSEIASGFTSIGVLYPDGAQTQRIGIVPDTLIEPTVEGIRRQRDEVLEKALEIAGCPIATHEEAVPAAMPGDERMLSCYPNPFHSSTTVTLTRPASASTVLTVFDIYGRRVCDLSEQIRGRTVVTLHLAQFPSPGTFFITLRDAYHTETTAVTIVR
jgi:carboxyl-terminal processing protease